MLDLSGIHNYTEAVSDYAGASDVPFFGITTTTAQLPAAREISEKIRSVRPDARIILGGPHVTLTAAAVKLEAKRDRCDRAHRALAEIRDLADVLVAGDGEAAIFRCFDAEVGTLIDADDPQGGLFMSDSDYNDSPWPARHLIDLETYRYSIEGHSSTSLISQLGCPFGCGFCGGRTSKSLRMIRSRTTESVVDELRHLHMTYGYTGFMFYDDELNVNQQIVALMHAIRDLQTELGVEFRLRGFVKSELFTPEQAHAMYAAGFRWLLVGFESGSPRLLDNINKRATLDDNTRAVEVAQDAGLKIKALMSVGHPGESRETVADTQAWLLETSPDDFDITIITTYPGTPYYDEAVSHESLPGTYTYTCGKSGDRLHSVDLDYTKAADYYKGDPEGGYRSYVFTDHLSADELVELRGQVEREVRHALGIEFNTSRASVDYEHSMGMRTDLPGFILRKT
jgi:radical SAM superfamily enzyme YgiQ (UPF0313 family)